MESTDIALGFFFLSRIPEPLLTRLSLEPIFAFQWGPSITRTFKLLTHLRSIFNSSRCHVSPSKKMHNGGANGCCCNVHEFNDLRSSVHMIWNQMFVPWRVEKSYLRCTVERIETFTQANLERKRISELRYHQTLPSSFSLFPLKAELRKFNYL